MHPGPTHICLCACVSTEALQLQSEALWIKHGRRSAQLEELMRSWEQWSDVTAAQHDVAKLQGAYLNTQSCLGFDCNRIVIHRRKSDGACN